MGTLDWIKMDLKKWIKWGREDAGVPLSLEFFERIRVTRFVKILLNDSNDVLFIHYYKDK
jgi:hypothetical protein